MAPAESRRPAGGRRETTATALIPALAIFLSGFASLAYQIVWVRRFAVVLGTTNTAVTLVLAMFLGGLGLGALLAGRSGARLGVRRLARRFFLLELGAAGFAAGLPLYLSATLPLLDDASPTAVLAAFFLLPAATLMGATLPTLTALRRRIRETGEGGAAGWLYAANTAGALIGVVAAARVLVPELGLTGSSLCGIAANLAAGTLVLARFGRGPAGSQAAAVRKSWFGAREMLPFGGIAALSGFAAISAEIGWARLAALLFGPSIYTFACVVASVILGVALGSAAAGRLAAHRPRALLAGVQLGGAAASAAVAWLASGLVLPAGAQAARNAEDVSRLLDLQFLGTAALLLLPSLAFGAAFPLAVAGASGPEAGRATGTIYAATAAGNVLGAFAAGLFLIPRFGIETALFAAVLAQLGAALLAQRKPLMLAAAGAVAVFGAFGAASWDWEMLSGGLYKAAPEIEISRHRDFLRRGRLVLLDQGEGATVSVKEVAGELSLSIDGKVDATDGADMLTQRMLAHLPLLLHPRPDSVLIVGHGSGVTAGAALRHPVERVTAAEISPEVARASRLFEKSNGAPWRDERFSLLETDARNYLLFTDERFDAVISEPSNPWMSGVSPLFTVEFFELARSRLREGGLFCQWVHLYNLAEESLRTLVGGFTDVFPEAALFALHDGDALLIGSNGEFPVVGEEKVGRRIAALADELAPYGITSAEALRGWRTAGTPALAAWSAGAPRHRDDHPILEFRAPFSLHAATASRNRRILEGLGVPQAAAPAALAARARGLLSAASPDWAQELAGRALELDPGAPAAETLVRAALASGRVAAGEESLRRALGEASPTAARTLAVSLARLLLLAGRTDEAAAALEGAPASLAEDREALLLAAEVQVARAAWDSAEALVLAALRRNPRDAEAAAWLSELSLRRGNAAAAAERAAAILAERPGTERALRVRAVALAELGEVRAARDAFSELVRRAPGPAIHWANFGAFELEAGRFVEAVRLYREAVDRDPANRLAYEGLLEAALGAGDREQARRAREVLDSG